MKYSYNELEQEINNVLRPIYLLYGEEQYLIETLLKKIKKKFGDIQKGINYILIDETNIEHLTNEIEMPSFCYDKKLIIVRHSHLFLPDNYKPKKDEIKKDWKHIQEVLAKFITDNLETLTSNAIIVFIEDEITQNKLYDAINKYGIIYKSDYLKLPELIHRLTKICGMYKVTTTNPAMKHLVETSGQHLMDLINEIRKLIEYVGPGGTITEKEVDLLSTKKIESVIWKLTEHMGMKRTFNALEEFENMLHEYRHLDNPAQPILISIYRHFRKLYLCQLAMKSNRDIIATLNLKSNQVWQVNKYKQQVSLFKTDLQPLLQDLIDLDYQAKTNKIDLIIGIQCIICKYC